MSNIVTCEHCHGTGKAQCKTCGGSGKTACPKCNGSGKAYHICPDCNKGRVPDPRAIDDDETMTCPTCHGDYKRESGACNTCEGSGKVECKTCKGSGEVGCKTCNATGKVDIGEILKSAIVTDWYDVTSDRKINKKTLSKEDVAMLKTAAGLGSGGACYVLGMLEHNGCISYTDEGDAYFEKGVQSGDADCLYAHAVVLSRKNQDPNSWNEMMRCLELSAEKGNVHALIAFVLSTLKGLPAVDDKGVVSVLSEKYGKALRCCETMANLKCKGGQSQYLIARANALGRYLPSILLNDTAAMTELKNICSDLYDNTGCNNDRFLASKLLEFAAKGGDADAVRQFAELNSEANLSESIGTLCKAMKDGDKKAGERLLVVMKECLKDEDRLEELKGCAKSGNVTVMKFLASAYAKGDGVKASKSQASDWLEMAANAGDGSSMLDVSVRYRDGTGLTKDVNKAFVWTYEGFIKGGSKRRALRLLAEFYRHGRFSDPDDIKANELYMRSANAGYIPAIVEVGKSYLNGWGVKKDFGEAKRLFDLASNKGSEEAGQLLLQIPMGQEARTKPICSITGEFHKDTSPLPDYVKNDYEKAKAGDLWTQEFEAKRKTKPAKSTSVKIGFDAPCLYSVKKRKTFVLLGILFGLLGLHLLYAKRTVWFCLYWLLAAAGFLQIKVEAFRNLVSNVSPLLASIPVFAILAGIILVGSIFLMKNDGKGNLMN